MPSKSCCRSCPRCNDCPVLVVARARAAARARREDQPNVVAALVEDVFVGGRFTRTMPDSVTRTLESLDAARSRAASPAAA